MHEREVLAVTRIVAERTAIDVGTWPPQSLVLRTAPDEVLMIGSGSPQVPDPAAIVHADTSWVGYRVAAPNAAICIEQLADWPLPSEGFAQGMVGGIAAKVWVGRTEVLFVVPAAVAADFEDRLGAVWGRSL